MRRDRATSRRRNSHPERLIADGSEPTTLALYPSVEAIAYAVTKGNRLLDCGVRPFEPDDEGQLLSEQVVTAAEATNAPTWWRCRNPRPTGISSGVSATF